MSLLNIGILSITEIFADFKLKDYARTGAEPALAFGILGYVGIIYYLIKALKGDNIMYINGMWDGVSGILETIAAYVILGERLDKISQYAGILMICIGTMLLHKA